MRGTLHFAGLSSNLAYITSVFIGYIGTEQSHWFAYQTLRC
ncbi:phage holin family protein [Staphylococcus aureus]